MPENNSIADKLELLKTEIDNIKAAINNNNHEGWAPASDTLGDLASDVESMHVGYAGMYQLAETNSAHINIPKVPDYAFNDWQNDLTSITYEVPLTDIGDNAFYNTRISEVPSPNTLKTIGKSAFAKVDLSTSTTNQPLSLPLIEVIDDEAFGEYSNLRKFETGNLLTYIGDKAFYNLKNLEYTSLSSSLIHIGHDAFRGSTATFSTMPNTVEYIGSYAFYNATNVTFTTMSTNIKYIGNNAFIYNGCSFTGTLPDCLEHIGDSAFDGQINLACFTGTIPAALTNIGSFAFRNQSLLALSGNLFTDTTIQKELYVRSYAFTGCSNLALSGSVNFNDQTKPVMYAGPYAFNNCTNIAFSGLFPEKYLDYSGSITDGPAGYVFNNCSNITFSQDNLTYDGIGEYAFNGCSRINIMHNITIMDGSIGISAFQGCTSLIVDGGIVFNNSAQSQYGSIQNSAFKGCTSLIINNSLIINKPALSYSIESEAFSGCTSLVINGEINVSYGIGNSAFANCTSLLVPDGIFAKNIGNSAFANCTSLKVDSLTNGKIVVDEYINELTFSGCRSMVVPVGIYVGTYIGPWAFSANAIGNSVLNPSEIVINNAANVCIGQEAFQLAFLQDTGLIEIKSQSTTKIDTHAFSRCRMKNLILKITPKSQGDTPSLTFGERVFEASALESVIMQGNIPEIPSYTFSACHLTSVTFDQSTTTLGNYAFDKNAFTSLDIPGTITTIGDDCFSYGDIILGSPLVNLTLNEGLVTLGNRVFYGNRSLNHSIIFPSTLKTIGDNVFGYTLIPSMVFKSGIEKVGFVTSGIPSGVTPAWTDLQTTLQSITPYGTTPTPGVFEFPNTLTEFGGFQYVGGLTSFTVKSHIKKFGTVCGCSDLTTLIFEEGVEEFGTLQPEIVNNPSTGEEQFDVNIQTLGFTQLKEIIFPTTMKKLRRALFVNSTRYTAYSTVYIDQGEKQLDEIPTLKRVVIQSNCLPEHVPYTLIPGAIDGGYNLGCFSYTDVYDIVLNNVSVIPKYSFKNARCVWLEMNTPNLELIDTETFRNCRVYTNHYPMPVGCPDGYIPLGAQCEFIIPASVKTIGINAFREMPNIQHFIFKGTPSSIGTNAFYYKNSTTAVLHVPWSRGEVAGAPWGFPGTIEYNSTYQEYDWDSWTPPV